MDSLPDELILKLMIDMKFSDLVNIKNHSKKFNNLYKQNNNYIYTKRLFSETCIRNIKQAYLIITNKAVHDDICLENQIYLDKYIEPFAYLRLPLDIQTNRQNDSIVLLEYIQFLDQFNQFHFTESKMLQYSITYVSNIKNDIHDFFINTSERIKNSWQLVSYKYNDIIYKLENLSNDGVTTDYFNSITSINGIEIQDPYSIIQYMHEISLEKREIQRYIKKVMYLSTILSKARMQLHVADIYFKNRFYTMQEYFPIFQDKTLEDNFKEMHNYLQSITTIDLSS